MPKIDLPARADSQRNAARIGGSACSALSISRPPTRTKSRLIRSVGTSEFTNRSFSVSHGLMAASKATYPSSLLAIADSAHHDQRTGHQLESLGSTDGRARDRCKQSAGRTDEDRADDNLAAAWLETISPDTLSAERVGDTQRGDIARYSVTSTSAVVGPAPPRARMVGVTVHAFGTPTRLGRGSLAWIKYGSHFRVGWKASAGRNEFEATRIAASATGLNRYLDGRSRLLDDRCSAVAVRELLGEASNATYQSA